MQNTCRSYCISYHDSVYTGLSKDINSRLFPIGFGKFLYEFQLGQQFLLSSYSYHLYTNQRKAGAEI